MRMASQGQGGEARIRAWRPRRRRMARTWLSVLAMALLTACAPSPAQLAPATLRDQPVWPDVVPSSPVALDGPQGDRLNGRVWPHPQAEHIVLGVHGFNDHSQAFDVLAQALNHELKATVYAYDQRGFGANPDPGRWPGSDALLADLRHIARQLRAQHPGLPLTVVGESMGGALVWLAAGAEPGLVADQIVLKAPAFWGAPSMPWYQRVSLQFMNTVAPDMLLTGKGLPSLGIRPTDDPEVSRALARDPLFIKATRISSLAGVTGLMGQAQSLTSLPAQRALVLYGLRDRIIPARPVCDWLSRLNTAPQPQAPDFVVYPDGWHLLTRQLRTREVLEDIRLWIAHRPMPRRQDALQAQKAVCTPP